MFQRAQSHHFLPSIQIDNLNESRLSIVEELPTPASLNHLAPPQLFKQRPVSEITEILESDSDEYDDQYDGFEEDEEEDLSEFEEDYEEEQYHYQPREGRHSNSTASTLEETTTPRSLRYGRPFELRLDVPPVEGPRGPHLFRQSTDLSLDNVLQMSPLVPKGRGLRIDTAFANAKNAGHQGALTSTTIASAPGDTTTYEEQTWNQSEPRTWTAQQVAMWMYNLNIDKELIEKFEAHDINGHVLLDLQFNDLKELGIQSFGKRHSMWNHICSLSGADLAPPSPQPTPFQDIDRPMSQQTLQTKAIQRLRSDDYDDCKTPISPGGGQRRRRKYRRDGTDPITPAQSVSIVAIEQLIPKPHKCAKGENCSKLRKQRRLLRKLHEEHGFPISPEQGGQIFIAGNPGDAQNAPRMNTFQYTSFEQSPSGPSVVASSDVLGASDMPAFAALRENSLSHVEELDPQDAVRNFLAFQHVEPPTVFLPGQDDFSSSPVPIENSDAYPAFQSTTSMSPRATLQKLPRLEIPRAKSAQPEQFNSQAYNAAYRDVYEDTFSPCQTAVSPTQGMWRFGTPATDMDVPVTTIPMGPIARETSQSVPPDMQYRQPEPRAASRLASRRPSYALPAVVEEDNFSLMMPPPVLASAQPTFAAQRHISRPSQDSQLSSTSSAPTLQSHHSEPNSYSTAPTDMLLMSQLSSNTSPPQHEQSKLYPPPLPSEVSARYPGVNYAGWMKKRKTKLLRHEWTDAHFRLKGSELNMHTSETGAARQLESLNLDEFTIGCSSISSNKLAAKLKAFKLGPSAADKNTIRPGSAMSNSTSSSFNQGSSQPSTVRKESSTGFEFQLIPTVSGAGNLNGESMSVLRRAVAGAKTHHFAVKTRDERMDWMREVMLAKALRAREKGFEVEVNGGMF